MKTIGNIAEILFGVNIQNRYSAGEIRYLQMSDFDDSGLIINNQPAVFVETADLTTERQLLQTGDILLPAKEGRNKAFYIEES